MADLNMLGEETVVVVDIKKRLLDTDHEGNSWLLAKNDKGELFIEHHCRTRANGDHDIRVISLVDFLKTQARKPAARELIRLLGLIVEDAEATSETS
ncbi:hypothetical protein GCM10007874_47330 [Labrys miyagiensis]|uniref:Uncharacterized protein n=1 Tax=Labrys miyagiensis TaxID=346912 RepID=A0ABQ6CMX8_9HYPH|nr:hypothetical protein [Labrys miyagiensis]GLS21716.1 hypothetical protein GCM10007874_47330 [Labrys miyagiensis]